MLITRPLSEQRARELLAQQSRLTPTYKQLGATRDAQFPAGYHHDRYECRLGAGNECFETAVTGLSDWKAHRGAGVQVTHSDNGIEQGGTVLLALPLGPLRAIAACRIIYVVSESSRFGFGYGTLPLHPEQGEESFVIERDPDGSVWFRVAAFSRPKDVLARLGAPVSRAIQRRVTNGYLRAMSECVNGAVPDL